MRFCVFSRYEVEYDEYRRSIAYDIGQRFLGLDITAFTENFNNGRSFIQTDNHGIKSSKK